LTLRRKAEVWLPEALTRLRFGEARLMCSSMRRDLEQLRKPKSTVEPSVKLPSGLDAGARSGSRGAVGQALNAGGDASAARESLRQIEGLAEELQWQVEAAQKNAEAAEAASDRNGRVRDRLYIRVESTLKAAIAAERRACAEAMLAVGTPGWGSPATSVGRSELIEFFESRLKLDLGIKWVDRLRCRKSARPVL
jgi:hypothetical protein